MSIPLTRYSSGCDRLPEYLPDDGARELAGKIIREIQQETSIAATAGPNESVPV